MANKVTIDVEARFIDKVSGGAQSAASSIKEVGDEAEKARKKTSKLGKEKVNPKVDADTNKFIKKIREAEAKAQKFGRTKTAKVLHVVDKASTVIDKVVNKAKSFAGKVWSSYVKVRDSDAVASLKNIGNMAKGIAGKTWTTLVKIKDMATAPLTKIKNLLFNIKTLIGAVVAGLAAKQFILNPINLADSYSSAQIGFSTLLGAEGGQKMMDEIDAFAKATPFKTSGVISNVQKMMAYGWDVDSVIKDMETIGDAAAATGKGDEGLSSIVYALSEIRSKGKLSTQELNQLASAGIKAKQYLAEGLGFGTDDAGLAKLSKALEKGEVGANQAIELILQGMEEFDGMMDKTANETVTGLWSQIEDTFEINIFRRWGQGLQDGAKRGFGSIVSLLDKADDGLEKFGDTVYEVGATISNFLADKLEDVVKRVNEITASDAFKNATLGGKVKMLWEGVIANPFAEWWSGTVVPWWNRVAIPWLSEKAGNMGEIIGKGLSNGLLALLGVDVVGAAETGASIAGSFAQGFREGFDGSAVADAFLDAINRIWDAMPWWAKALLFGYGAAKVGGMINNLVSGISMFIGNASTVLGSAASGTGLLGFGANAAINMGAGNLAGGAALSNGALSALGLTSTAGLITGGITAISGGVDLYKGYKNNDETAKKSGWWKVGGAAGGAALGAAIGSIIPGVGTLIGTGIGALAGSLLGNWGSNNVQENAAEKARELAEAEQEAAVKAAQAEAEFKKLGELDMAKRFGAIALSADEVSTAVNSMIGQEAIERATAASAAIAQMEESLRSFNSADSSLKKNLWLIGVKKNSKLTSDELNGINNSAETFSNSAKTFLEDAQYASSESITAIMGNSEEAKKVLEKSSEYYEKQKGKLGELTNDLSKELEKALSDNVISLDEQKSLDTIRSQIAEITRQIQQDQYQAELNIIKAKYGDSDIDVDSFKNMMNQMNTTAKEMEEGFWNEFGQGSIGLEEGSEEWNALLKSTLDNIKGVWLNAGDLGLDKLQTKWSKELGILGEDVYSVFRKNTIPEITSAAQGLSEETRAGIDQMLQTMQPTTEQIQNLADTYKSMGMEVPKALSSYLYTVEFYEALAKGPEAVEEFYKNQGPLVCSFDIDAKTNMDQVSTSIISSINPYLDNLSTDADLEVTWTYDPFDDEWITPDRQYGFTTECLLDAGWTYDEFNQMWISPDGQYAFHTNADVSVDFKTGQFVGSQDTFGIDQNYGTFHTTTSLYSTYALNKFSGGKSTFGINDYYSFTTDVEIKTNYVGTAMSALGIDGNSARGGIWYPKGVNAKGYAAGGMVRGGARLIKVAEEGTPEMIIPLGSQRRERGIKLWEKTGQMLGIPGFARGGMTDGGGDEGLRFHHYEADAGAGGQIVQVEVGGIKVEIQIDAHDTDNIIEAIKEQANDIAEAIAGIMADSLGAQFENTPVRG